jgi:hypothetical protein
MAQEARVHETSHRRSIGTRLKYAFRPFLWHFRFGFVPRDPRRSRPCAQAMRRCLYYVSAYQMNVVRDFRAWYRDNPDSFAQSLWSQLDNGQRCYEYARGPYGWSGDRTIERSFFADFVGVRHDLLVYREDFLAHFTMRHEFEHEIQRKLEHLTDEKMAAAWWKGLCAEAQANVAARDYTIRRGLMRSYNPCKWVFYLYVSAFWCSLRSIEQTICIIVLCVGIGLAHLISPVSAKGILPAILIILIIKDLLYCIACRKADYANIVT